MNRFNNFDATKVNIYMPFCTVCTSLKGEKNGPQVDFLLIFSTLRTILPGMYEID